MGGMKALVKRERVPVPAVKSLDFDDHPFRIQSWSQPCGLCGAAEEARLRKQRCQRDARKSGPRFP